VPSEEKNQEKFQWKLGREKTSNRFLGSHRPGGIAWSPPKIRPERKRRNPLFLSFLGEAYKNVSGDLRLFFIKRNLLVAGKSRNSKEKECSNSQIFKPRR